VSRSPGSGRPAGRPVGAICHGVLVLARTRDAATGRSVLAGRPTTCLPKNMERLACLATAWRVGRYYRTYPACVQDEVEATLDDPGSQFQRGPLTLTARGTAAGGRPAFAVADRNYLSARWPGDTYLFARRFCDLLQSTAQATRGKLRPRTGGTRPPSPKHPAHAAMTAWGWLTMTHRGLWETDPAGAGCTRRGVRSSSRPCMHEVSASPWARAAESPGQ
jgi:hypothetical protein